MTERFPGDQVFRDIDSLKGGEKWGERIDDALAHCSVVIPVIGPTWLTAQNEDGSGRRLDDPGDRLRLELEAAIRRGVPLIPLLVGGAATPPRQELPDSLQPLVDWQAMRLSDETWRSDFEKLAESITRALETKPGELPLGSEFAGYEVEAFLGRGGMGVVYKGRHLRLGRDDAIKVIAPYFSHDPEFRARFGNESMLAARVRHPNVLTVYDADEETSLLYISMQLVEGQNLASLIAQQGPLPPERAAGIVCQVAGALQAAHEKGLVHRDVKPGNVLIEQATGHVFLSDFGLAREETTSIDLSTTGRWAGTSDYVSPEQVRGKPVDGRADIYSLGCVLYQALSGSVPFPVPSETAKLVAHATEDPTPLHELNPDIPDAVCRVVRTAMAREPENRYQSAAELSAALESAVADGPRPSTLRPVPPPPSTQARRARSAARAADSGRRQACPPTETYAGDVDRGCCRGARARLELRRDLAA